MDRSPRRRRRFVRSLSRRKAIWSIAIVATFGLFAAACSSSNNSSGGQASGNGASSGSPHRGGSVTQITTAINTTIDPAYNVLESDLSLGPAPADEAVYGPGLVYLNPATGAVEMGFAKSLTSTDNGRVWTLVLRPGLKFSDGTAFNAAAVAYNYARLASPATGSSLQTEAAQLQTKVINATTLQITCTPIDSEFPTLMADDFAMIASPTAIKSEGKNFGEHPVGPGPFKVTGFTYGISWSFTRNPYYQSFAPGQPYLDSIKIVTSGSQSSITSALQTGSAQAFQPYNGSVQSQVKSIGFTVNTDSEPEIGILEFNVTRPPFNNVLAREAVYDALNRTELAATWQAGDPVATNLFTSGSPFYNPKYDFPNGSSSKAQQLFNQLAAEGQPVKFSILWPTINSAAANLGAFIVGELSQYKNVSVTEDGVSGPDYIQSEHAGGFQMTGTPIPSVVPGLSTTLETGGTSNYGHFSDPILDSQFAQLQATTNQAQQQKLWDSVQQEIIAQYAFIPTWRGVGGFAYNPNKIGGVFLTQYGQVAFWGPMYLKQ